MSKSTSRLLSTAVSEFIYRGIECEVRELEVSDSLMVFRTFLGDSTSSGNTVNGYMTGPINVTSYDHADEIATAHGGFTFFDVESDGRVTLGFDTGHGFDGPETQNVEYVTQAIKDAVDSLYDAGAITLEQQS